MGEGTVGEAILIRYDGLDADRHEIELNALSESLAGLSQIIGVTGNFAATERYVRHRDALAVRIVVQPPKAHCFEIMAWVKWGAEQPLISATLATLTAGLITYVVSRAFKQRQEMKYLKESLETAIRELGHRDQPVIDRLLDTIDKMADALKPSVRKAVRPVGETAETMTVGSSTHRDDQKLSVTISRAERDAILAEAETELTSEQTYHVIITEVDIETGACKVSLDPTDDARYTGKITDPALSVPMNAYVMALAQKKTLSVRAKALLRSGEIERLYISNTA
jgi:hypothetical protein